MKSHDLLLAAASLACLAGAARASPPGAYAGGKFSCSSGSSVDAAQADLYKAQTELENAQGFKASSAALDHVSRAQEVYNAAFACRNMGNGNDPTQKVQPKFTGDLPDPSAQPRPAAKVSTLEGVAPPGYSAFQGQDAPPPAGIRYTPPAGFANSSKRGRHKNRASISDPAPRVAPAPTAGGPIDAPAAAAGPRPAQSPQTIPLMETKTAQGRELVPAVLPGPQRGEAGRWTTSAQRAIELGDFLEGLMDAERALGAAPANPDAYRLKAQALCALGRFEEARDAAVQSAALAPQSSAAHEVLAWALANLGDYAGAARSASRALELDGNNAFAYAIRGFARGKLGDKAGAIEDARLAAARNPVYLSQAAAAGSSGAILPAPPGMIVAPRRAAATEPAPSGPPLWPALLAGGLLMLMFGGIGYAVMARRREP